MLAALPLSESTNNVVTHSSIFFAAYWSLVEVLISYFLDSNALSFIVADFRLCLNGTIYIIILLVAGESLGLSTRLHSKITVIPFCINANKYPP
jgi:hypothetical protein